jgi:glycosyltransferase involved in cell wall biosynthesis
MKHIAFATYELAPVNPGGAGVVIAGAIRALAWAGYRSTVVCDFPEQEVDQAQRLMSGEDLAPGAVGATSVSRLVGRAMRADSRLSIFESKSKGFALALEALHRVQPIHLLEFPEYAGIAFSTLQRRINGSALASVPVIVRIHGGMEFIDQVEGVRNPDRSRLQMYRLERLALQLADYVLGPSQSICDFYCAAYGLGEKVLVSPPPVENLTWSLRRAERFPDPGHFLFYGKLQEVKGCDLFLEAAVSVMADHPERNWRFTLVGSDTPCFAHGRPTSQCLKPLIPSNLKHAFEFIPSIDRADLPKLCRSVQAAVVPSRFESFCLAAHELRTVGVPLIVSSIPAFSDYFSEGTGCLTFNGSSSSLKNAMLRMSFEPGLADSLADRPRPAYQSMIRAYQDVLYSWRGIEPGSALERRIRSQAVNSFDA